MVENFQEFTNSQGVKLTVDKENGILRGVKLLGLTSKNKRRYAAAGVQAAVHLYEGAKVNVNHPKGNAKAPRDYQDRFGTMKAVSFREDGLYGDFHFNPKHALAEQLIWDAEHAPENVGFSHNIDGIASRSGGKVIVESIEKVNSVDLVADPATTSGLYEHEGDDDDQTQAAAKATHTFTTNTTLPINEAIVTEWLDDNPTIRARLANAAYAKGPDAIEVQRMHTTIEETQTDLTKATEKVAELTEQIRSRDQNDEADRIMEQSCIPSHLDTKHFRTQGRAIFATEGQTALEDHINDRRTMAKTGPLSRGSNQHRPDPVTDGKSYAEAITR